MSSHTEAAVVELLPRFYVSKWVALMTKAQENLIRMTNKTIKIWDKISKVPWKRKSKLSIRKSKPKWFSKNQAIQRVRKVQKEIGVSETSRKRQLILQLRILWSRLSNNSNCRMDTTLQVLKKRKWASMQRDVLTRGQRKKLQNKRKKKLRRLN